MGVVIKMVDTKRGAGRPRQHDLMTPLRQWVIQNYKGDYAAMAKELGISVQYLEDILTGARYPSTGLALKIKRYTQEALDLDALLDYPRPDKTAA